jgi:hypothetical protein
LSYSIFNKVTILFIYGYCICSLPCKSQVIINDTIKQDIENLKVLFNKKGLSGLDKIEGVYSGRYEGNQKIFNQTSTESKNESFIYFTYFFILKSTDSPDNFNIYSSSEGSYLLGKYSPPGFYKNPNFYIKKENGIYVIVEPSSKSYPHIFKSSDIAFNGNLISFTIYERYEKYFEATTKYTFEAKIYPVANASGHQN